MPYLNGYYVDRGEYLVCAYPGKKNIAVCINYGKFKEAAGVKEGDPVTIALKEAEGAKLLQETFDLTYSSHRQDYDSDEIFANFRMITLDTIPDGKLYRSASPVHNDAGRSAYAYTLMIASGINAVMNLADSQEELTSLFDEEAFDAVEYRDMYEDDRVIALGMPVDYASDSFAQGIVEGLTFLSKKEPPYLIHCNEGKDRAGFTSMILEALTVADPDTIVEDYMLSYVNYYGTEPGTDKYDLIADKNILEMFRVIAGTDAPDQAQLQQAAIEYLTSNGMEETAIKALQENLIQSPALDKTENVQYVMYLGTNDKDTNKPVFTQTEAMEKAQEILINYFGGYTILEAHGGWIDEDTEHQEYTLVIYLSDTTPDAVHAAADELIETFRQSSVLIQANPTTTEFYSGAN